MSKYINMTRMAYIEVRYIPQSKLAQPFMRRGKPTKFHLHAGKMKLNTELRINKPMSNYMLCCQ
jgi:hypothetical protein